MVGFLIVLIFSKRFLLHWQALAIMAFFVTPSTVFYSSLRLSFFSSTIMFLLHHVCYLIFYIIQYKYEMTENRIHISGNHLYVIRNKFITFFSTNGFRFRMIIQNFGKLWQNKSQFLANVNRFLMTDCIVTFMITVIMALDS